MEHLEWREESGETAPTPKFLVQYQPDIDHHMSYGQNPGTAS